MKMKNLYLVPLIFLMIFGLISCGDNTDFYKTHNLTDEEAAEIARQDSILKKQLESINAELVLSYTVEDYPSANWTDQPLYIDIDAIAQVFGLTAQQVLDGINQEAGAPDIVGFAINATTHADVMSSSTTDGPWGHWWTMDGDVGSWGQSDLAFYCEWWGDDDNCFWVGQYPGALSEGFSQTVLECLKYGDHRIAVQVTFKMIGREDISSATIVNTQQLAVSMPEDSSYGTYGVEFDAAQTLADLGVASMDDVSFIALDANGNYVQDYTADNGFWYGKDGFVGEWGDDASIFIEYHNDEGLVDYGVFSVGQYPGSMHAGDQITVKIGAYSSMKIEMYEVTATIISYDDPENKPGTTPTSSETSFTLTLPYNDDYEVAWSDDLNPDPDVWNVLRETFNMTTYEIYQAIENDELLLYVDEVTNDEPYYTADAPGYWLATDGTVADYAYGVVWCSLDYERDWLAFYAGCHPDNCPTTGVTVNTKYIFVHKDIPGVTATFNITIVITEN